MSVLDRWVQSKALTLNYAPDLTVPAETNDAGPRSPFYPGSHLVDEKIDVDFQSYVERIYKRNGIVYACIAARMRPFSEARFALQDLNDGRGGRLHGSPKLRLLERPWPNGTTGELLVRMEQDHSLAGNFYGTVVETSQGPTLRRMRPDWVAIVSGVWGDMGNVDRCDPSTLEAEPIAYIYAPPGKQPRLLSADKVVHYSPEPDPISTWRGMSWITPVVREIQADEYATNHKTKWFQNGAALSTVISYDPSITPQQFAEYVRLFNEEHRGPDKAYETLHIGGGSSATTVGTELKTDFREIQGAGETRIAAASGVGAVMARFSEGLQGSALNQGNYDAAKRQVGDMLLRPLWRTAAGSLSKLVQPDPEQRLWYDARDVEFLKEDRKDASEIQAQMAATMKSLIDAGYKPDSVATAVQTGDFDRLEHSGLYSVQLQAVGSGEAGGGDPVAAAKVAAEVIQKVYLGVGKVLTEAEARAIATRAGADLAPGPLPGGAT